MRTTITTYMTCLWALTLIAGCGEERIELNYDRYQPTILSGNDGELSYDNLTTYPILGMILSDSPRVALEEAFQFRLDTVVSSNEEGIVLDNVAIDGPSGIIRYDNTDGSLSEGTLSFNVALQTTMGTTIYQEVLAITVLEVPVALDIDASSVQVGALEQGVIATVTFTDTSVDNVVADVTYALEGGTDVFEINPVTGQISKTGSEDQGIYTFDVIVETNVGRKTFPGILAVEVGEAPALQLFQQDGITGLSKVTLSPNTGYTMAVPQVTGISPESWEAVLPDTLLPHAAAFSVNNRGQLVIAPGAGLPVGDHGIGLTVNNASGASFTFENVLTLTIETRAATSPFLDEQMNDMITEVDPQVAYPGEWAGYSLDGGSVGPWQKAFVEDRYDGMRRIRTGPGSDAMSDAVLVRRIDVAGKSGEVNVAFGDLFGFGGQAVVSYDRSFYFGTSDANISSGNFVESEWELLLEGEQWLGINWNGGNGPANEYTFSIDLNEVDSDEIFLMWRLRESDNPTVVNGVWVIDYVTAEEASLTFPPEEE